MLLKDGALSRQQRGFKSFVSPPEQAQFARAVVPLCYLVARAARCRLSSRPVGRSASSCEQNCTSFPRQSCFNQRDDWLRVRLRSSFCMRLDLPLGGIFPPCRKAMRIRGAKRSASLGFLSPPRPARRACRTGNVLMPIPWVVTGVQWLPAGRYGYSLVGAVRCRIRRRR